MLWPGSWPVKRIMQRRLLVVPVNLFLCTCLGSLVAAVNSQVRIAHVCHSLLPSLVLATLRLPHPDIPSWKVHNSKVTRSAPCCAGEGRRRCAQLALKRFLTAVLLCSVRHWQRLSGRTACSILLSFSLRQRYASCAAVRCGSFRTPPRLVLWRGICCTVSSQLL